MMNELPSIEFVRNQILEFAKPLAARVGPALANQLGVILSEDIFADSDMPVLPTSRMDGYALRTVDAIPGKVLPVFGTTRAGEPSGRLLATSGCFRIATGAPLPQGADCVIPHEQIREVGEGIEIIFPISSVNNFIRNPGEEYRKGQLLLKSGTPLGPVEYGLLALAGRTAVKQIEQPKVALISTGNEIIEPGMKPAVHQIRNSNGPMLMAQLCRAGSLPRFLGIAPDKAGPLQSLVREGATHDVLVLSGGASKGECDLVRNALVQAGYEIVIPGVMMRPGKPFFCARHSGGKLAFGLPGNPVSAFVCLELFVRPAIQVMRGIPQTTQMTLKKAGLESPFKWSGDRPFVVPMKKNHFGKLMPCSFTGSSDLLSISGVDSLAVLAASGTLMADDQLEYFDLE